jgi:hypothetical protein
VVANDSVSDPSEDFANNVGGFLFDPAKLQGVSPEAYKWIERHFGANFRLGKGHP